ncbi:MAG: hypothetical protein P4L50_00220 [Anaerolineaceae bacterium]|nr:hypothetical protein [Anaerolineaceae bacterium]
MTPNSGQIAGLGAGATAGGSLLSAGGSIASGFANSSMFNYQASIARLNQQIDSQNAEFATQTGEQQALQFGLKARAQMGQIKASEASSGFDVRTGSNAQVQASQRGLNLLDADVIRSNAAKTAYNYETQGTVAGAQADLYTMAGSNALTAGFVGAGTSILGGAASVSNEWLKGQMVGLGTGDDSYNSGNPQFGPR